MIGQPNCSKTFRSPGELVVPPGDLRHPGGHEQFVAPITDAPMILPAADAGEGNFDARQTPDPARLRLHFRYHRPEMPEIRFDEVALVRREQRPVAHLRVDVVVVVAAVGLVQPEVPSRHQRRRIRAAAAGRHGVNRKTPQRFENAFRQLHHRPAPALVPEILVVGPQPLEIALPGGFQQQRGPAVEKSPFARRHNRQQQVNGGFFKMEDG